VKISGLLSLEELQEAGRAVVTSTQFPPDIDTIWDLCDTDPSNIDEGFMEKVIAMRQQQFQQRLSARLALVADSDLKFALSRMYEMMASELQQSTHVFRTIEEAKAWLSVD
jgi:hypothetical protein